MTAQANVPGQKVNGEPRRYFITDDLIHIIRTRTGNLTWCGLNAQGRITPAPARAKAQSIENRTATETKGRDRCRECFRAEMPQPDPAIWGPPRPPQ